MSISPHSDGIAANSRQALIDTIEAYIAREQLSSCAFGAAALGDATFVGRLGRGAPAVFTDQPTGGGAMQIGSAQCSNSESRAGPKRPVGLTAAHFFGPPPHPIPGRTTWPTETRPWAARAISGVSIGAPPSVVPGAFGRCGERRPQPERSFCEPCAEKHRISDRISDAKRRAAGRKSRRDIYEAPIS